MGRLGVALALLTLTKAVYLVYGVLLLAGLNALALGQRRTMAVALVTGSLALAAGYVPPVGAWVARNAIVFGSAGVTDARGTIALSTRAVFDEMTWPEYGASFSFWTRGFGARLVKQRFDPAVWHRLQPEAPDGFYLRGQVTDYEQRIQDLENREGFARAAAEKAVPGRIVAELVQSWPMYLATMLPVFYRGLWIDEFIVIGFPSLAWLVIMALRRRWLGGLAAVSAGAFSLLFYAAISLNIPRYQMTALPALACATAVAAQRLGLPRRAGTA